MPVLIVSSDVSSFHSRELPLERGNVFDPFGATDRKIAELLSQLRQFDTRALRRIHFERKPDRLGHLGHFAVDAHASAFTGPSETVFSSGATPSGDAAATGSAAMPPAASLYTSIEISCYAHRCRSRRWKNRCSGSTKSSPV